MMAIGLVHNCRLISLTRAAPVPEAKQEAQHLVAIGGARARGVVGTLHAWPSGDGARGVRTPPSTRAVRICAHRGIGRVRRVGRAWVRPRVAWVPRDSKLVRNRARRRDAPSFAPFVDVADGRAANLPRRGPQG